MKKIILFALFFAALCAYGQQVQRPKIADYGPTPDYATKSQVHDSIAAKANISDTATYILGRTRAASTYQAKGSYAQSSIRDSLDLKTLHSIFATGALAVVATQKGFNEAIDSYILRYRVQYQGIAWNENTDLYQRLGSLQGLSTGSSPGNGNLPVQSKMRGCLLEDNGSVNYYLADYDWSFKEDGSASTLTGADGQVMVEIPAFYYKYAKVGNWNTYCISLYQLSGYTLHPAFTKDNVNVAYRYISAYEGSLYDESETMYANGIYLPADTVTFAAADSTITVAGVYPTNPFTSLVAGDKIVVSGTTNNNSTFTVKTIGDKSIHVTTVPTNETSNATLIQNPRNYAATTGDKLSSVSGKIPVTCFTRAQARVLASNRGTGWRQLDADLANAIQLLMLIEYGTFYIQNIAEVGPGITNISGWDKYNNYNPFAASGNGNTIGNSSGDNAGATSVSTEKSKYSCYRGVSNFYGHIYKYIDGLNINTNVPYITNNSAVFGDDTSTGYTNLGVTMINGDGYIKTLTATGRMFAPLGVGGGSSTYLTDYYYQSTGWRVAVLGGAALPGAYAGPWFWLLLYGSDYSSRSFGARLAF